MKTYVILVLFVLFMAIAMVCMALSAANGWTPKDAMIQHTQAQTAP